MPYSHPLLSSNLPEAKNVSMLPRSGTMGPLRVASTTGLLSASKSSILKNVSSRLLT